MMRHLLLLLTLSFLVITSVVAAAPPLVSTLSPEQLQEYRHQPETIRKLIRSSLELTRKNLTYLYGSNSPKRGGMDCSGTVQYILKTQQLHETPRQADQIHNWLKQQGTLKRVTAKSLQSEQFRELKPGDLLFWSGTYAIKRDITHVMIYLGTDKTTGKPVMVGASDGRRYNGLKRRGVSVFDFKLPRSGSKAKFVGYGSIPGLVAKQTIQQKKEEHDSFDGSSLVF